MLPGTEAPNFDPNRIAPYNSFDFAELAGEENAQGADYGALYRAAQEKEKFSLHVNLPTRKISIADITSIGKELPEIRVIFRKIAPLIFDGSRIIFR